MLRSRLAWAFAFGLATVGCGDNSTSGTGGSSGSTTGSGTCALPCTNKPAIAPEDGSIDAASGLATSLVHEGVIYAHNDSGDVARFFAIGANGSDQGTYNVTNANAVDWEDMARGPCGAPSTDDCLYFGDIGDNTESRASYVLYRVAEPTSLSDGSQDVTGEAFEFTYPDGPHDAETLLVHPTTGRVYIITKDKDRNRVFGFPGELDSSATATLDLLADVYVPGVRKITGGDINPAGDAILLRSDVNVWLYSVAADQPIEEALRGAPCSLPAPEEAQGEAIAWRSDGTGYLTMAEGEGQLIHTFSCE